MKHFSKDQLLKVLSRMLFVLLSACSLLISIVQAEDLNLYFTLTEVKEKIDEAKKDKQARCLIVFPSPTEVSYKSVFCKYNSDKRDDDTGNLALTRAVLNPQNIQSWLTTVINVPTMGGNDWVKFTREVTGYLQNQQQTNTQTTFSFVAKPTTNQTSEKKITLTRQEQQINNSDLNKLPQKYVDNDDIFAFLVHQSIVNHFRAIQPKQGTTEQQTKTVDNTTGNPSTVINDNDKVRTEIQKVSGEVQPKLKNIQEELQRIDRGKIFSLPADYFLAVMLVVITILIFAIIIISSWKLKGAVVNELSRHIDDQSGVVTGQMAKTVSSEKLQKLFNSWSDKLGEVVKEVLSETKLTQQLKSIQDLLESVEKSIKGVKDLKWWEDNLATIKNGLEITELSRLNQQLNEINGTNEQLRGDLKEKGETLTAVTKERDGLKDDLKIANDALSQTVENLQEEKTHFEEQGKQLAESNRQKDNFQTQFENEQKSHLATKESHEKEVRTFEEKVETLLRERFCLSKPDGERIELVDWMGQLQRQKGTWQWLQVMLAITLSRCEGMVKELKTLSIKDKSPAFSKLGKVIEVIEPEKLLTIGRTLTAGAFVSDEELRARLLRIDNGEWLQRLLRAEAVSSTYFSKDEYQTLKPLFEEISAISSQLETVLRRLGVEFYKPQLLGPKFDFDTQVKMVTETSFSFSKAFKELVKLQVEQRIKQRKADPAVGSEEIIVWVSKYGIKENQNSEPAEVRVVRYNLADWRQ